MATDYEKKYKEALERAKRLTSDMTTLQKIREFIFPELVESEDERIRKALIWHLKAGEDFVSNGVTKAECLAYLEKQKENPKSIDSIQSDCMSNVKCEYRWHKVGDSLPDNPREVLCKDEAGNYFIGRYYSGEGWEISNYDDEDKPHHLNPPVSKWIDFPSEKQKEQKPAEVDESTKRLNDNWMKQHFDEYTEQKPAEWSEEEKEILDSILSHYVLIDKPIDANGISKEKYISLIKSIRFDTYKNCNSQKQEWDTHDKAIVNCIVCCLDGQFVSEAARKKSLEWFNKHRRDFLNSTSWKPSEEQMDALHRCVDYLHGEGSGYFDPINSLYEQLKKL